MLYKEFCNFFEKKLDSRLKGLVGKEITACAKCVIAVFIPVWIMRNQRYENLLQAYMSNEFAEALAGVIDFFTVDCNSDVNMIATEYKKRFYNDKGSDKNLHNQRRLLNYFYWELESCAKDSLFLRHKIKKEFTRNEGYIAKLLIYINNAVDSDPTIFKDISAVQYEPLQKTKGINISLEKIFRLLKKQKRWIE